MKLGQLCEIKYDMPEADFYLYVRGSEKNLGMPIKDPDTKIKKVGIKVKKEAKTIIDPDYLYYLFMHLHNSKYCQNNGLVYGSLELKNLRIEDIKNISFS